MVDVLVVCTANEARSPLLAALLQRETERRPVASGITIGSAGTDATFGRPAAPGSRIVADTLGCSLEDHRAVSVALQDLSAPVLFIVMDGRQRRELVRRAPSVEDRTFRLRELVAIAGAADRGGATPRIVDELTGRQRLEAVARVADRHRPPRWRTTIRRLNVPDPIGAPQAAYDDLGAEFLAATELLAPLLFGPLSTSPPR